MAEAATSTAAKMLREYETVFLIKPDVTDDNIDKLKERVRVIVNREGGKLIRFTTWGKKKTMYPIAKQPRAVYIHASYLGQPGMVAEVERNLHNIDEVSRWMSKRLKGTGEIDPETRPVLEDVKLAGDVDDNKPLGGAERDSFRGDDGGFDGGFDEGDE